MDIYVLFLGFFIGLVTGLIISGTHWKYKVADILGIDPPGFGETTRVLVTGVKVWSNEEWEGEIDGST